MLAVEDGPTLTHGGMPEGAAALAARRLGATLVDPRPHAQGRIASVYRDFPAIGPVLPAMGYGAEQMADLAKTIEAVPCDVVLLGTPVDLRRSLRVSRPVARVRYEAGDGRRADLRGDPRPRGPRGPMSAHAPSAPAAPAMGGSLAEVFAAVGSSPRGLGAVEARTRLDRVGADEPGAPTHAPVLRELATMLANPLCVILLLSSRRARSWSRWPRRRGCSS